MTNRKRTSLSDQARQAIIDSGIPQRHVARQIGIGEAHLSRFVAGKAGLGTDALDRLGELLDLSLTVGPDAATAADYPDARRGPRKHKGK